MALKNRAAAGDSGAGWMTIEETATSSTFKKRGIFLDIVGLEGQGKSSLAMTLAELGPIGYVDIDQSFDRAKKPDTRRERDRVKVLPVRYAVGLSEDETKKICGEAWVAMEKKIRAAAAGWAKGIVIDTSTEDWEVIRLGSFGTLTPRARRMDRLYGPVNAKYRTHLRSIYRTAGKHLVTIHQLKDEYVDKMKEGEMQSVRTGNHVRAGFKEIGYMTDIVVRCSRIGNKFKGVIDLCKLPPNGPDLEGMEIEGDDLNFASIVALATGTEREEWL